MEVASNPSPKNKWELTRWKCGQNTAAYSKSPRQKEKGALGKLLVTYGFRVELDEEAL